MNDGLVPRTDRVTRAVVEEAAESLGILRGLPCVADPGVALHLTASIRLEAEVRLAAGVDEARRHGYSWAEIASLLGDRKEVIRARYDHPETVDLD